jgi:hypothetical protein
VQIEISDDRLRQFVKEVVVEVLRARPHDDQLRQLISEIVDQALTRPRSPILVAVPQASQMLGRGVAAIYQLMGAGKIRAVKSNGRTLIPVASLHEYVKSLPEAKIAPPRKRLPQHLRRKNKNGSDGVEAERS